MAGALAAFFGCPLGGSLFAIEVNSRFGIEYFEHTIGKTSLLNNGKMKLNYIETHAINIQEAIFAGEVSVVVFRGLAGIPLAPIWEITLPKLENSDPMLVVYGAFLGLIGSLIAYLFAEMHYYVMAMFSKLDLLRNERAVYRALLGSVVIVFLGMLVPQTMFWGESEFQAVSTMGPTKGLDHIWPTSGLIGFEMDNGWKALVVGLTKLIAISFTVCGGYRGGYIFPAMLSGAAFGRAIFYVTPYIPVQICVLCLAGAINVAITRTAIATTIILAYLSGEPNSTPAVLASCLVALFATGYMPFIKTQIVRADIDASLYHDDDGPAIEEETHENRV
jgi:H+/Cl- antiporter ClcA